MSKRNKLMSKISKIPAPEVELDPNVIQTFSKERIITYASVILFPPYGLYRVWDKESTFRRSEKWMWTFIVMAYLGNLLQLII